MDTKTTANIYKALCDENRIEILQLLQSGEKCACTISDRLGIAQSKLSYHMKILCNSGLVECRYVGKWTHYQISKQGSDNAIELLKQLTTIGTIEITECSNNEE